MDNIQGLLEALRHSWAKKNECSSDQPVKAYAWARVSTEHQDRRGDSIDQQLREIHAYADRQGIEIVEDFREAASAFSKNGKRPEFYRMVEKAKADPSVTMIIVHDFSRFSRDSIKGRELFRELSSLGIKVRSVNDPDIDPDTAAGLYSEAFTFAKNEAYSREIAFHTKKGCRANIRARDPESGLCFKNGAKPLWGFKMVRVDYGVGKGGRAIQKTIWVLDDTIVAGKPVYEWVRYVLMELAAKGSSIARITAFLNEHGIPGRRCKHWGRNSFRRSFDVSTLLKYAGYGIWGVRNSLGKNQSPDKWEIVENAHPAIITPEEVIEILRVRGELLKECPGWGKAGTSNYLLSGGLAHCDRCGANLIGHKTNKKGYYVCASEPYRAGKGCGKGVYIPQLLLEGEVINDIQGIIAKLADPVRFTKKVNEELRHMWEQQIGYTPDAEKRIREIDGKIEHIRELLENGLNDVAWANGRIRDLRQERDDLVKSLKSTGEPLQVDASRVLAHRADLQNVLQHGTLDERKQYIRPWIESMTLYPEEREVRIRYRVPASVLNTDVTGTLAHDDPYHGISACVNTDTLLS